MNKIKYALRAVKELEKIFEELEQTEKVKLSELAAGDKFSTDIGTFIVLEQTPEGTKVITENLYREDVQFDDNTKNYKESALCKLCDEEIFAEFAEVFGAENIIEHEVDLTTVDMQKDYGTMNCKVRPITFDEARKYNDLLVNKELPDWYWTCTHWSTDDRGLKYSVAVMSPAGNINNYIYNYNYGVRPFCILKSNIFVSKED